VNETQPLAIIEALAHGLPFIASKVGGIPAMTGGPAHPAGICLDCHAPSEAWVAAVQHLISKYSRYSEGAYTTYRRHFSRKAYWDGLRSLMKNPPSID
jgi:glycosyltransferase involved in cell wall biosynthesis